MRGGSLLAKVLWAITVAVSALVGGGAHDHANEGVSALGSLYIHSDAHGVPSFWTETNGEPGLQTELSLGEGGILVPPDARLMT